MKRQRNKSKIQVPDFLPDVERPYQSKWKEEYVREVFFLSLLGATDMQIAQTFGVGISTLETWKRTKPAFLKSMKKGKIKADTKVVNSLFLAAVGYSHPDQVVLSNKIRKFDEKGKLIEERTEPLIVNTIKSYPPNVTAAIKWLQARQPDVWAKKVKVEGLVEHSHKLDLSSLTEQELEVLKKLNRKNSGNNVQDIGYEDV